MHCVSPVVILLKFFDTYTMNRGFSFDGDLDHSLDAGILKLFFIAFIINIGTLSVLLFSNSMLA